MDSLEQDWPEPLAYHDDFCLPPWGSLGRDVILGVVSCISYVVLRVMNKTEHRNIDCIRAAIEERGNRALVTYSNHTSTFDDPGVISSLMPTSFWFSESSHLKGRWSLCAREYCFMHPILSDFFRNGKVFPVERGMGTQQPCVGTATRRVVDGDWVHIFAEGMVNWVGAVRPLRWGIGRVLCDAVEAEYTGRPVSEIASRRYPPVKDFPYPDGYWEEAAEAHERYRAANSIASGARMLESAADHAAGGGMPGSTAEMTAGSKAERRRTTAADGDEKRRVRVRGSELAERAVGDAGVGAGDKETRDEGAFKARGEELDGSSGGKPVAGDSREVREGTVGLTRSGGQGSHARIGVSVRGEGSSHGDSWIGGASDKKMPLVVPFYHTGMADLMPARAMVPRVGKRVTVTVGDPVEVGDLLRKCACQGGSRPEVWAEIAKRLHSELVALEAKVNASGDKNTDQTSLPWFPQKIRPRRRRLGMGDDATAERREDNQGRPMS